MRAISFFAVVLAISAAALSGAEVFPARADARVPVLLELFTSEGCSSCPPADRLLATLDEKQPVPGADLIVLSEHVDYWNRLGWKDPFSSPQYSVRQEEYASKFSRDGVYTPQLVVDGRFELVGSDAREAQSAIEKSIRTPKFPISISKLSRIGDRVVARVDWSGAAHATNGGRGVLYLAIADNRAHSQVVSGENAGRSLTHVGVLRVLTPAGAVDLTAAAGKDVRLTAQPGLGANGSRLIVFVQDLQSGRILAVTARTL